MGIPCSLPLKVLSTIQQAAQLRCLSVRRIAYLITSCEIASRRVGRRVLIHRDAIERFARQDHFAIRERKTARPRRVLKIAGQDRSSEVLNSRRHSSEKANHARPRCWTLKRNSRVCPESITNSAPSRHEKRFRYSRSRSPSCKTRAKLSTKSTKNCLGTESR